jgi:hypothetical protein
MTTVRSVGRAETEAPGVESHKAVLFCPRCCHRSEIEGDWVLVVEESTIDVHCPDCWRRVTSRPR